MADIDTISVLLASVQSCLQVILLCVVGYFGAGYNIITRSTQEGLSRLIINILMPSLLFSSIGFEIDATKLIELWPVLFFYVLFFLISGSLGFFGGSALRLDKPKTKFVMTGILFNNVTSLSLGLLRGMEKTSIMEILTWNKEDTPSEAVARGTTYVLLSTFMGNLLRWSVGVYLLKNDKNDDEDLILPSSMDNNKDDSSDNITEPPLLLSSSGDAKITNERAAPLIKNDSYDYFSGKVNNSTIIITPTTTTSSKTSTPSESGKTVNERTPLIRNDSRDYISIINDNSNIINSSLSQKHKRSILRKFIGKIGKTLNPPLGAALLGLFVGVIPPLKSLFFGHGAPFYLTITHTIEYLGSIAVPLTLISLGAQLKSLPHGKGQQMLPAIGYVMFCRFLLMPAIGITIILLTRSWYISDPMFLFVLILLACGPPAVNCINMTRLTRSFEEEMATLLFYSYIAVVPMITMLLMVVLSIISSIETQS